MELTPPDPLQVRMGSVGVGSMHSAHSVELQIVAVAVLGLHLDTVSGEGALLVELILRTRLRIQRRRQEEEPPR